MIAERKIHTKVKNITLIMSILRDQSPMVYNNKVMGEIVVKRILDYN